MPAWLAPLTNAFFRGAALVVIHAWCLAACATRSCTTGRLVSGFQNRCVWRLRMTMLSMRLYMMPPAFYKLSTASESSQALTHIVLKGFAAKEHAESHCRIHHCLILHALLAILVIPVHGYTRKLSSRLLSVNFQLSLQPWLPSSRSSPFSSRAAFWSDSSSAL